MASERHLIERAAQKLEPVRGLVYALGLETMLP